MHTTPDELADQLEALPAVAAADVVPASDSPRRRTELEILLTTEHDALPRAVAMELYSRSFAPSRLQTRHGRTICIASRTLPREQSPS